MTGIRGISLVQAAFADLGSAGVARVAKSTMGAGLAVLKRAEKKAAPKGATGQTRASIGSRVVVSRKAGFISAKTGIGVGKKKQTAETFSTRMNAPHAHLVALGTKPRYRKRLGGKFRYLKRPKRRQLSTGVMPANSFIQAAFNAARPAAAAAMERAAHKALEREMARAAKRQG